MVYQIQGATGGVYEVPTDWTITLVYNVGYFKGGLSMRVKATNFVDEDKVKLDSEWQPTGTYHVTKKEL